MISDQSSSTLASDYQLPPLLIGYGSTSGFDSDEDKPPEKMEKDLSPYQAFRLRVEAPRSDANLDVFTVIGGDEKNFWSFFKPWDLHFSDDFTHPTSLQALFMAEFAEKQRNSHQVWQAYRVRIEDLRSDAELDGFTVNEASENDFWSFILSMPFACKAELVILDNGNLRIIWDDEDGNHFGLQFLGDRRLQYVIFRRRRGTNHISRVAGQDTFDGVKRQVRAFQLETLLQV